MNDDALFKCGIGGTVATAVCCFTPALAILLTTLGLSAWLGWLDYVLLPALAAFIVLAAYAFHRRRSRARAGP